jgi:alpha-tubulin suppressor-like RCC1 family protein
MATPTPIPDGTGTTPTPTPSATALPYIYGMKLWLWGDNTDGQLGDGTTIYRSSPVQTLVSGQVWCKASLGSLHAGGILNDYSLWTWGRNNYGQLGDGTILNRSSPVNIGTDSWLWVSCGYESSAGIKTDGSLWLWGLNSGGQLGTQNIVNYSSPVQIYGNNTNWKSVSVGYNHTAAIKNDGSLWTWGQNSYGQLGSNNLTAFSSPIQTALGGNDWIAVAAGANFSLAVKNNGTIWGFGLNAQGQLGDGNNANLSYPTQIIPYGTNWLNAAAGFGFGGAFGPLGTISTPTPTPSPSNSLSPTPTPSVTQPTPTPLPTTVSKLFLWGSNNFGQLGDNTTIGRNFPAEVFGDGTNWSHVSAGYRHFGGLKADGSMYMWGYGAQGQLAQDNTTTISTPIQNIITNRSWVAIACGRNFTGGLETGFTGPTPSPTSSPSPTPSSTMTPTPSGTGPTLTPTLTPLPTPVNIGANLWAWGQNSYGQIGDGNYSYDVNVSVPVLISSSGDWSYVGGALQTSFAVKKDGTFWSWGSNLVGQAAQNTTSYTVSNPTQVGTNTNWQNVGWSYNYGVAIKADGTLWFWGEVPAGNDTAGFKSSPTQVGTGTDWVSVNGANRGTVHAVKSDGTMWVWGANAYGLFGNGNAATTLALVSSPIQMGTDTNWLNVGGGTSHVLATRKDGTLWAWGRNESGQLGDNTTINRSSPVQVAGANYDYALGGHIFSLAIRKDGSVWSWGGNYYGELGQNDGIYRSIPTQIGTSYDYQLISASTLMAAAIKQNNTLWIWGANSQGQCGNNSTTAVSSPIQVAGLYYDVTVSTMTLAIGVGATPLPTVTVTPTLTPSPTMSPSPSPTPSPTGTPAPLACVEYHNANLFDVTIVDNKYIYTNKEFTVGDVPYIEFWTTGYGQNNNELQLDCGPAGLNAYRVQVSTDGLVGYNGPCGGPIYVLGYSIPNGSMRIDIVSINATVPAGSITGVYYIENCGPTPTVQPTTTPSNTDPTPTPTASPMPTPSPTPSAAIMYIWGNNAYGQLGQSNVINYSSPVIIGGSSAIWTYLAGGGSNFGATKKDGSLWVWGENYQGQLANNNMLDYSSMIQVGSNFDMWNFVGFGGNNIGGFGGGIKNPIPSNTPSPTNPTPTVTIQGPTPTPSSTAATPTPSGTNITATPTGTPVPTRTPLATAAPTRTQLPTGTPTPSPTMSPTPSPTPSNTGVTPTPTGTEPTSTPTFAPTLPPQTTPPAGASWICSVDEFGFESKCIQVAEGTGDFLTFQDCSNSGCGNGATPTFTPTSSPVPTVTPLPTGTEPTATPLSTDPSATPTATPTSTPSPSNTDPTMTPSVTPSPTPTPQAFNLLFLAWG